MAAIPDRPETVPSTSNATAIQRILVPLDGSDTSLAALAYARQFSDATLILLQVGVDLDQVFPDLPAIDADAVNTDIHDELETVAGPLRAEGFTVETIVVDGDPADRIVAIAAQERADLIAMTTAGRGAAGRIVFGSVADRVSRTATVPTLLVRKDLHKATVAPARIVVTLDGSPRAETALPVAERIAVSLGLPIALVRVVTLEDSLRGAARVQQTLRGRAVDTTDEAFALAREETVRQAESSLSRLAASLSGEVSTRVLHGSPAASLLHELQPSDLAIVTSHGASGMSRWLIGSVAEKLVREAPAPIVLVPARETAGA